MKDYKNIIFVALEDKGGEYVRTTCWALKGDVFRFQGDAVTLGLWTLEDEANSGVWKNDRTGKIEYDERIWNSGLLKIEI